MIKHFISLEWKSFFRSASLGTNLVIKIFSVLAALYFMTMFTLAGVLIYPLLKDSCINPLTAFNRFLIYYFVADLVMKFFFQKMPSANIKPFLTLPIPKNMIVGYALGKTKLSFFNWIHAFLFIPVSVVMILDNHPVLSVLSWSLGIMGIVYSSNFLNILIDKKDSVFYPIVATIIGFGVAQYYQLFDVTVYTSVFFNALYHTWYLFLLPLAVAATLYYFAFIFFRNNLALDEGLARKTEVAQTENYTWLNQFGTLGTFLKNDIRLIKRNKRSRTTIITSVMFLFYGLLFFTGAVEGYDNNFMQVFGAIFVTGGFLFTFGQFVPSWDSSYYQLMMSQNIQYRDYLNSKWWLMVIATMVSAVLTSFYLYFGWKVYALILAGAIYNIGVNSSLVLLAGAFVKTPIDLTVSNKAFGNKQAFNFKVMLISLPKLLLPIILYVIGNYFFSQNVGFLLIAAAGVLGLAFRNKIFTQIEKIYKAEKYETIAAYKQGN